MKTSKILLNFGLFVILTTMCAQAQEVRIPLNEAFLSEATDFKVKKQPSAVSIQKKKWKKNWNFFGTYVASGWSKGSSENSSKGNFWGSKFEQGKFVEWNYKVSGAGSDTLQVHVAYSFSSKEKSSVQPIEGLSVSFGEDELISQKVNIAVYIESKEEEEEPWVLLLSFIEGTEEDSGFTGRFFKGENSMEVMPLSSEPVSQLGGLLKYRSHGYVFEADGKQMAAIQNFNADVMKPYDRFVWLADSLDEFNALNLAAAISSILLLKDDPEYLRAAGLYGYAPE